MSAIAIYRQQYAYLHRPMNSLKVIELRKLATPILHPACPTEKILATASTWNANLIVLGLRHVEESSRGESTWAKAYEIVRQAGCPVMTIRVPG